MDATPLKVVFDVSVLDSIGSSTFRRAGVFRVVERLALQLAVRQDCCVAFSCCHPMFEVDSVMRKVVRDHPELAYLPTVDLWPADRFRRPRGALERLRKRPNESVSDKVRRKLLRVKFELLQKRGAIDVDALQEGCVFHSPWEPLPHSAPFRQRNVRRALTLHDMTPVLFPHFFADNRVFRSILASIEPDDHIVAVSECTKRDFCDVTKHEPSRVHVTPLAADEVMFFPVHASEALASVRRAYRIPDGPYLLSVNTIQPRKNLEHCIRSFTRLVQQERIPDLSLVLVGDSGWKTSEIAAALRSAGRIAERVVLTGYVPDHDLAPLYSGATAFIYVSHYEGFGLPPLEAMQCGVAVIAANNSSLPEVVGDAGLLVPATDGDALCAAMLSLYRDTALREAYAARAVERARQFSWRRCADLTVAAYRRMKHD